MNGLFVSTIDGLTRVFMEVDFNADFAMFEKQYVVQHHVYA